MNHFGGNKFVTAFFIMFRIKTLQLSKQKVFSTHLRNISNFKAKSIAFGSLFDFNYTFNILPTKTCENEESTIVKFRINIIWENGMMSNL